jgi:hypothetical protein
MKQTGVDAWQRFCVIHRDSWWHVEFQFSLLLFTNKDDWRRSKDPVFFGGWSWSETAIPAYKCEQHVDGAISE